MAKYKNFGELEKGGYVFSAKIIDSTLFQDCMGQIFERYIIKNKSQEKELIKLELIYDKSTFLKDWTPDMNVPTKMSIDVKSDDLVVMAHNKNDEKETLVNCIIYATNVEDLTKALEYIIEREERKASEYEATARELIRNVNTMRLNFQMRRNMRPLPNFDTANEKPHYNEVEVTEEVYV